MKHVISVTVYKRETACLTFDSCEGVCNGKPFVARELPACDICRPSAVLGWRCKHQNFSRGESVAIAAAIRRYKKEHAIT